MFLRGERIFSVVKMFCVSVGICFVDGWFAVKGRFVGELVKELGIVVIGLG